MCCFCVQMLSPQTKLRPPPLFLTFVYLHFKREPRPIRIPTYRMSQKTPTYLAMFPVLPALIPSTRGRYFAFCMQLSQCFSPPLKLTQSFFRVLPSETSPLPPPGDSGPPRSAFCTALIIFFAPTLSPPLMTSFCLLQRQIPLPADPGLLI